MMKTTVRNAHPSPYAFDWINRIDEPKVDFEYLACTEGFDSMDMTVLMACKHSAFKKIDLPDDMIRLMEERDRKRLPPLTGRQAMKMIYEYYESDAKSGSNDSFTDTMSVKFLGDDKLQQFLDNWDNVLACMDSQPPQNILILETNQEFSCFG
jgi:hypothetical protein